MSNRKRLLTIVLALVFMLLYISLFISILPEGKDLGINDFLYRLRDNGFVEISILVTMFSIAVVVFNEFSLRRQIKREYEMERKMHPDIEKITMLLDYSKKRKEIEQEISRLTNALAHSDVNEYININRLVFAGQSGVVGNGLINYDQFFSQFGIDKEAIEIKKGYAVFLTPFDQTSKRLFSVCSSVLNGMGILLQRTDNSVEKNDIMMNIVSQIVQAEFLIVNIDGRNPNVYYELGIAHAIGKPTILISKTRYPESSIGFDIRQKQIILYENDNELEKELLYQVNRIRNK